MNVLVACEESQEVCKAFRAKGHKAFSCDIQECSGGHPEWHIMGDIVEYLKNECVFCTQNRDLHFIKKWDMIIAFPPCTDLAVSGARHFERKRNDGSQQRSIDFFMMFTNLDYCDKVAIENPIGIMSTIYRKPIKLYNRFNSDILTQKVLAFG